MVPTTLGQLISDLYTYSLSIVGLCVFAMFLYAGVNLLIGRIDLKGATKIFQDAIIGAVLLYSAYIILNSINHDLVSQRSGNPATSTGNTGGLGGLGGTQPTPTQTFQPGGGGFGGAGASSSF